MIPSDQAASFGLPLPFPLDVVAPWMRRDYSSWTVETAAKTRWARPRGRHRKRFRLCPRPGPHLSPAQLHPRAPGHLIGPNRPLGRHDPLGLYCLCPSHSCARPTLRHRSDGADLRRSGSRPAGPHRLGTGPLAWLPLRFLLGAAINPLFVLSEVWIIALAPPEQRGRVMGIYATIISAGFAAGPLSLILVGSQGWPPFAVGIVAFLLCGICLAAVLRRLPSLDHGGGEASVRRLSATCSGAAARRHRHGRL